MIFTVNLWAGESVAVEVDGDTASVNGNVIPQEMLAHAIEFGFRQLIRDAGAGAKDDAERNALAMKKVDALVNGTLRQGTGGGARLTDNERQARVIAEREVRAALAKAGKSAKAKDITELAAKHLEKSGERIRALAATELAAIQEMDLDIEI